MCGLILKWKDFLLFEIQADLIDEKVSFLLGGLNRNGASLLKELLPHVCGACGKRWVVYVVREQQHNADEDAS